MRRIGLLTIAGLIVASCAGDDTSGAESTNVPVPTNAPTTTEVNAGTTAPTTAAPATTATTSTTEPVTSSTEELGPPPTAATTTTTEPPVLDVELKVPEADPALLNQVQANPDDFRNNRPIEPEHILILETYVQLFQDIYEVYSTLPLDPDAPAIIAAPLSPELLPALRQGVANRLAAGQVLNVEQGVTWRPFVVGPVGETATVFDCELVGHYWIDADTGEPVPPDNIWYGVPGEIVSVGLRTEMRQQDDGRWVISDQQITPEACE